MNEEFTKKSDNKLRIDKERNLIFIPGQDSPKELIAPIQERVDADGMPYQHVVSATELIEAEEQHRRCMKFIVAAMNHKWQCVQCKKIWPGTTLQQSPTMLATLGQMLKPGGARVNWDSIIEHLAGNLFCPGELPPPEKGKCKGKCEPIREVPA